MSLKKRVKVLLEAFQDRGVQFDCDPNLLWLQLMVIDTALGTEYHTMLSCGSSSWTPELIDEAKEIIEKHKDIELSEEHWKDGETK